MTTMQDMIKDDFETLGMTEPTILMKDDKVVIIVRCGDANQESVDLMVRAKANLEEFMPGVEFTFVAGEIDRVEIQRATQNAESEDA